jgi:hypothetical protein
MSATLKIDEQAANGQEQKTKNMLTALSRLPSARSTAARRRAWLVLLGLSAMFVTAALWRPPDEPQLVLCPFRLLTHYPCPGCGMTRAFCALAHFELWRAIKFNALSPLLFLAALVWWAHAAATILRVEIFHAGAARLPRLSPAMSKLMLALVLAWWAARLVGGF